MSENDNFELPHPSCQIHFANKRLGQMATSFARRFGILRSNQLVGDIRNDSMNELDSSYMLCLHQSEKRNRGGYMEHCFKGLRTVDSVLARHSA